MPLAESVMAKFENVQLRMTPSFSQPTRMALAYERSEQLTTATRSQGFGAARLAEFARTTIASSPVSMRQSEIRTSREQLTWIPSWFGYSTLVRTSTPRNLTRSQSFTQKLQPDGGSRSVTPSTRTSRQPAKNTTRGGD